MLVLILYILAVGSELNTLGYDQPAMSEYTSARSSVCSSARSNQSAGSQRSRASSRGMASGRDSARSRSMMDSGRSMMNTSARTRTGGYKPQECGSLTKGFSWSVIDTQAPPQRHVVADPVLVKKDNRGQSSPTYKPRPHNVFSYACGREYGGRFDAEAE